VLAFAAAGGAILAMIPWGVDTGAYPIWTRWFVPSAVSEMWKALHTLSRTLILPLTVGLSILGVVNGWRNGRTPTAFALVWMWTPVVLLALLVRAPIMLLSIAASAWYPLFFHRYVFACVVPFCILVALGVLNFRHILWRMATIAALAALSIPIVSAGQEFQYNTETKFREAAALIVPWLKQGTVVNVELAYSALTLRYYVRNEPNVDPELITYDNPHAQALILTSQALLFVPETLAKTREYPILVARLPGLVVLKKSQ
jgi:hypothetical protein